jgi:hypothetical protein
MYRDIITEFIKMPALFWGTHLGNIGRIIALPVEMVMYSEAMKRVTVVYSQH